MPSHAAVVTEIEELAPSVLQITIAFADDMFRFQPGQWVNFRFPEGVSRAYTIASAPERPRAVQLCVRMGPGKGGAALKRLEAGATVTVEGPYGDSLVADGDKQPVMFLAGDTGIASIRRIVLHMLSTRDPRPIALLYDTDPRHILYAGTFAPLARDARIVHESGKIETLIARNRRALN